ncbi:PBP1A family penicillin-binding protein [Bacillaceae bacterium]
MEVIRETSFARWFRLLRQLCLAGAVSLLLLAGSLLLLVLWLRSQPLPPLSVQETTTIYAADGQVIDTLHGGENRVTVPLAKIPKHLQQATIAVEDRHFYDHFGFDFKGIARAALVDLQRLELVQGASTITQQLARNLYLTLDKNWKRKIQEALLTIQLEIKYTKDEILEKYLNEIYYGHSAYGVQAAAQTYFGKDASALSLAESAMLAGIPKGPAYYSPLIDFQAAKARQWDVLQAMVKNGYITQEEANRAYQEKLTFQSEQERSRSPVAPYFRDYVIQVAKEEYGLPEERIKQGGLKIYTTLDVTMQAKAEAAVAQYLPKDRPLQAALVAIEPQTGKIRAMVGGRDYAQSQYNRAFAKRQPGSSFKPLLYLAALQNGFTPLTRIKSEPTAFTYGNDQIYVPSNFGDRYSYTFITLQHALKVSDNIYAVKTHMSIGEEKLVEMAQKLGIASKLEPVPSLALGTYPVSPLEMAGAYAAIANSGQLVKPHVITKITDSAGNVLVEAKPEVRQVVDPAHAFVLTQMMQGVFAEGGTAHRVAHLLKRPVAGKTGTTDWDAWLSGFTPRLAATVWVGYDKGKKLDPVADAYLAAPIWAKFMEEALTGTPPELFPVPEGVTAVYIDPDTDLLATEECPRQELVYFVSGTEPGDYCQAHSPAEKENGPESQDGRSIWEKMKDWLN